MTRWRVAPSICWPFITFPSKMTDIERKEERKEERKKESPKTMQRGQAVRMGGCGEEVDGD